MNEKAKLVRGSVKTVVQWVIGLSAVLFMIYGVYRGEVSIVLNKAMNLCLECIGFG